MRLGAAGLEVLPLVRAAVAVLIVFDALRVTVGGVMVPLIGLAVVAGVKGATGKYAFLVFHPGVRLAVRVKV